MINSDIRVKPLINTNLLINMIHNIKQRHILEFINTVLINTYTMPYTNAVFFAKIKNNFFRSILLSIILC